MSYEMVNRLIRKDWFFHRWTIAFYFTIGALGLATIRFGGGDGAFYLGSVVLITALIGVGVHLIIATVVVERTEKNLPFVMSLPITAMEYTCAKIIANLSAFALPWLTLLGASLWLIQRIEGIPDGLVPFAVITLTEIAVAYCIMLAIAIVSESVGWTIFTVTLCNLGFNLFLYAVSHLPAIADPMAGPVAVWNQTAIVILATELIAIALIIAATFILQARKKDFL